MPSSGTPVRRSVEVSSLLESNRIRHQCLILTCEAFARNACATCRCRHGRGKLLAYTDLLERGAPDFAVLYTGWKNCSAERSDWQGSLIGLAVLEKPSVKAWVT